MLKTVKYIQRSLLFASIQFSKHCGHVGFATPESFFKQNLVQNVSGAKQLGFFLSKACGVQYFWRKNCLA